MKQLKHLCAAIVALALIASVPLVGFSARAMTKSDPAFAFTLNPDNTGLATINDSGEVEIEMQVTPGGYGNRVNANKLGPDGMFDVRNFSTTLSLDDVAENAVTLFALDTLPTGTLSVGKGLYFMFRHDPGDKLLVAVYDSAQAPKWAPAAAQFDMPANKLVGLSIDYENATAIVTVKAGDQSIPLPIADNLITKADVDKEYADANYLGYYSVSAYNFVGGVLPNSKFTIKTINNKTPLAIYTEILEQKVAAFETAVNALSAASEDDAINAAKALDTFAGTHATLLATCDDDGAFAARIETARGKLAAFNQRPDFNEVKGQIDACAAALETMTDANVKDVVALYKAIDVAKMATLTGDYKTQVDAAFAALKANAKFKTMMKTYAEQYVADAEKALSTGDAASLSTYKTLSGNVTGWAAFKTQNELSEVLTADELGALDTRVAAVETKLSSSFYAGLWTQGDTWEARKSDLGLYTTGKGAYGETLGFNKKLTLGVDTKIEFNIISALRRLGSNHLHIGFYPKANTGTRGDSDGIRVDFWFSAAGTVEVKPVNGKDETDVTNGLKLSLPDTADNNFDPEAEEPDFTVGKFVVELLSDGDALIVRVNGQEIDIVGIDASLFANGAYLTVSAMSVEGADYNELLITKVGSESLQGGKYAPAETDPGDDPKPAEGNKKKGCGGVVAGGGALLSVALFAAALAAKRKQSVR